MKFIFDNLAIALIKIPNLKIQITNKSQASIAKFQKLNYKLSIRPFQRLQTFERVCNL